MPISIPSDILDYDAIKSNLIFDPVTGEETGFCTHPAGHCFGSDGGSGIPANLKVAKGRGGDFEIWKLNAQKNKVLTKQVFGRCQYCLKYNYVQDKI